MEFVFEKKDCGYKLIVKEKEEIIGRAYLYVLKNELHKEPFGFLEDVFVLEKYRGRGIGKEIVKKIILKAKSLKCYKLIANSRFERKKVHTFYKNLGFRKQGYEFRIDLK